jgi:threonine/homoserine/homoserine lactone efflux protein
MEGIIAFVVAGFALTGSPGPATLGLAAAGAAFGPRRCVGLVIGFGFGITGVIAITASGLTGLVLAIPSAAIAVGAIAGLYILYLAYRIATAPPLSDEASDRPPPSIFAGALLAVANPKAYAAMAALFSGFVLMEGRPEWDAVLKVGLVLGIMCVVTSGWLSLGVALTRVFRDPQISRIINIAFAVLLIGSVALAFLL